MIYKNKENQPLRTPTMMLQEFKQHCNYMQEIAKKSLTCIREHLYDSNRFNFVKMNQTASIGMRRIKEYTNFPDISMTKPQAFCLFTFSIVMFMYKKRIMNASKLIGHKFFPPGFANTIARRMNACCTASHLLMNRYYTF